jgi:hypothetical protein
MPTPLVGLLLLVASSWLTGRASAQDQAVVAPTPNAAEPSASVEPAAPPSEVPAQPPAEPGPASLLTPPTPSGAPRADNSLATFQQRLVHQYRVAYLASSGLALADRNRNYLPGVISFGVGALAMIVGGVLLQQAFNAHYDWEAYEPNRAMARAAGTLLPIGAVLVITGTCLFAVRFSRARRLARIKEALEQLGVSPAHYGLP